MHLAHWHGAHRCGWEVQISDVQVIWDWWASSRLFVHFLKKKNQCFSLSHTLVIFSFPAIKWMAVAQWLYDDRKWTSRPCHKTNSFYGEEMSLVIEYTNLSLWKPVEFDLRWRDKVLNLWKRNIGMIMARQDRGQTSHSVWGLDPHTLSPAKSQWKVIIGEGGEHNPINKTSQMSMLHIKPVMNAPKIWHMLLYICQSWRTEQGVRQSLNRHFTSLHLTHCKSRS